MNNLYTSTLITFFSACLLLVNSLYSQTTIPAGVVYGNWTLQGSPYFIEGEITVPNDSTLDIDPGVVVEFQGHYKLNVQGKILAIGTENDSIIFTINDTTGISNDTIPDGGWHGIRFDVTPETNDSSKIQFCHIEYGKAIGTYPDNIGAGIFIKTFTKVLIANNAITSNYGLGIACVSGEPGTYDMKPLIRDNIISHNYGGGIACDFFAMPEISNNIISYNEGTGIRLFNTCNSIVCNNIICNNTSYGQGGGIMTGYSFPVISNNIICNNQAITGGGISSDHASPILLNNIICNNLITNYDGGGGIYAGDWSVDIYNCIVWGNEGGDYYPQIACFTNMSIQYSNVEGGIVFSPTIDSMNIDSDPLFTSPTAGAGPDFDGVLADWTLQSGSPCINAGTPDTSGLSIPVTDFAGDPRVINDTIDIGVYEYGGNTGISELIQPDIIIFPNPTNDYIVVNLLNQKYTYCRLINNLGAVVLAKDIANNKDIRINVSEYQSGIYYIQAWSNESSITKKIVLE